MLNKQLVKRKIKLIQEDMHKLEQFSGKTFDEIEKDNVAFAAMERYMERIVSRALDINQHMLTELGGGEEKIRSYRDTFLALADLNVYEDDFAQQIAKSAGLRNRLVHEYNDTDPEIIFNSLKTALRDYTRYCEAVLEKTEKD